MSVIVTNGPKATPGTTGHKGFGYQEPASALRMTQGVYTGAKADTVGKIAPKLADSNGE